MRYLRTTEASYERDVTTSRSFKVWKTLNNKAVEWFHKKQTPLL